MKWKASASLTQRAKAKDRLRSKLIDWSHDYNRMVSAAGAGRITHAWAGKSAAFDEIGSQTVLGCLIRLAGHRASLDLSRSRRRRFGSWPNSYDDGMEADRY
jgi:hypothetical protein